MTIDRHWRCNLCRDMHNPVDLVPLRWENSSALVEADNPREVEHHLCMRCFNRIRQMEPRCIAGIRGCTGGLNCTSDHK